MTPTTGAAAAPAAGPFRRACVTGGAGFIGSHLVRALLARGLAVTVLDNLSVGRRGNVPAGAELVEGDILDPRAVDLALRGCDALFHLAARVAIRSSFEFATDDAETNVVGTASILQGAARAGTVRRVIATSSMAVYADAPRGALMGEGHPTVPISPYGVSKLAAERLTHLICANAGMESVVLRLFNTYGRGQALTPYVGVVTIFVHALRAGRRPIVFGDGNQARDFVHVEDVARAFLLAMDAPVSGGTFNVGTGRPLSVNAVLAAIQRAMGTAVEPDRWPAAAGEARFAVADIAGTIRALGYVPRRNFADSVPEVVADILKAAAATD